MSADCEHEYIKNPHPTLANCDYPICKHCGEPKYRESLLAAEINELPERVRLYIHDLETNADPAGTIQSLASTKEQLRGTIALLREGRQLVLESHDEIAKLKKENKNLEEIRNCLEFLLTLKDLKDREGKTDYYLSQMPNSWVWARRILGPFYRGYKKS